MIQWGATLPIASGANLLHAFPVAFASALPTVVLSYPNNSVDGAKGDTYIAQLKGISLANMTVRNLGPSPAQYSFIAIGR